MKTCVICRLSWFPRIRVIRSGYLTCTKLAIWIGQKISNAMIHEQYRLDKVNKLIHLDNCNIYEGMLV